MFRKVSINLIHTKAVLNPYTKIHIRSPYSTYNKILNFCKYTGPFLCENIVLHRRNCSSLSTSSSINYLKKIFTVKAESPSVIENSSVSEEIEYIPPPPEPPECIEELVLNSLGEPTLQSLGLAGWSPVGILQSTIEFFHVTFDVPWWGAIAIVTFILRMSVFPLVILSQRNAAKLHNVMPRIQALQSRMSEARTAGNHLEASKIGYDLQQLMVKEDVQPIKNLMVPLMQAPIFISMFMGLRGCTNLPVESFKDGGMLWFTDLTLADPYLALPILTAATLYATIEVGTEGKRIDSHASPLMRYGLRCLPLIIFPFTVGFPSAILCYWMTTNAFSLCQVGFLKIPSVRDYFAIDPAVKHKKEDNPAPKKGFVQGIQESWSNMKIANEIGQRQKVDEIRFRKAGSGPVIKTFKEKPIKKQVIDITAKIKR